MEIRNAYGIVIGINDHIVKREREQALKDKADRRELKRACLVYDFDFDKIITRKSYGITFYELDSGMGWNYGLGETVEQAIRWIIERNGERL